MKISYFATAFDLLIFALNSRQIQRINSYNLFRLLFAYTLTTGSFGVDRSDRPSYGYVMPVLISSSGRKG